MLCVKSIGKKAEDLALQYLLMQGLQLITRNYSCRFGEIDLMMQDSEVLVFVEVRYRKNSRFGKHLETIHITKQTKLIKTAAYYLQSHCLSDKIACRFDVIGINSLLTRPQYALLKFTTSHFCPPQVEWIKNAFSL